MKIATVGGAMRDIFIQYKDPEMLTLKTTSGEQSYVIFAEGRKIEIDAIHYAIGGGALNSAVSFARLGFSVTTVCKVGNDENSAPIIGRLQHEGINTQYIKQTDQYPTGRSFIIPSRSGNRVVLIYRGANMTLGIKDIPASIIDESDAFYITSLSGPAAQLLLPLVKQIKSQKKLIAINPGTSQITHDASLFCQSLGYIDVLIVNAWEAHLLMRALAVKNTNTDRKQADHLPLLMQNLLKSSTVYGSVVDFFNTILQYGPSTVIVTNGKEGVYATDGSSIYFHPSIPAQVVSTLGAGDAFGSTLTASLLQKKSLPDAIRSGVINSAQVLQHMDTQTGLVTTAVLQEKFKTIDTNLLQKYSMQI